MYIKGKQIIKRELFSDYYYLKYVIGIDLETGEENLYVIQRLDNEDDTTILELEDGSFLIIDEELNMVFYECMCKEHCGIRVSSKALRFLEDEKFLLENTEKQTIREYLLVSCKVEDETIVEISVISPEFIFNGDFSGADCFEINLELNKNKFVFYEKTEEYYNMWRFTKKNEMVWCLDVEGGEETRDFDLATCIYAGDKLDKLKLDNWVPVPANKARATKNFIEGLPGEIKELGLMVEDVIKYLEFFMKKNKEPRRKKRNVFNRLLDI